MMLAALVVVSLLLVVALGGLAYALARLHDVEEAVALHELALGHLTQPGAALPPPQPRPQPPLHLLPGA